MKNYTPKIIKISNKELKVRAIEADSAYKNCNTCGAHCNTDRTVTENKAKCKTGFLFSSILFININFLI